MVRRVLGMVTLVALTACAGDDSPALDGPVPTTESTTPSSTTTTEATTTVPPPACPAIFGGDANPEQIDKVADVDGDGEDDEARSFRTEGDGGTRYALQVELAAGGGASTEIPANEGEAAVALLAATPVDPKDPRDVLWVRTGSGAAATIVGLYRLDGCDLEAATFANGDPVELAIGGTVGTVAGAACGSLADPEADLLVHEATHLADDRYEVITTELRWDDGTLSPSPATAPTVSETDDPAELGHLTCGEPIL